MASAVMDLTLAMDAHYTEFNIREDSDAQTLIRLYDSATRELERLADVADSGILLGGWIVSGGARIEVWDVVPLVHVRLEQALRAGGKQVIGLYQCGPGVSVLELNGEDRGQFAAHFSSEQRLLLKFTKRSEGLAAGRFYLGIDGRLSANRVTVDFPLSLSLLMGTPTPAPVAVMVTPAPAVVAPARVVDTPAPVRKPVTLAVAPTAAPASSRSTRKWIIPSAVLGVGLGIGLAVWAPRSGADKPPASPVARTRAPQAAPPTMTIRVEPRAPVTPAAAHAKQVTERARTEAAPKAVATGKQPAPKPFVLARATPQPSSMIDVAPPAPETSGPLSAQTLPGTLPPLAPAPPGAPIIEQRPAPQAPPGAQTPATRPKPIHLATPVLNSKARTGVRGEIAVSVAVEVDAAGRVISAVPINRPMDVLATAAVEAARNSVFEPATAGGQRVAGKLRLQFRFKEEPLRLPVHSTLR